MRLGYQRVVIGMVPLALLGLFWLGQMLHAGEWLESLPFAYQVLAKIALILVLLVGPFVGLIILMKHTRA